MIDICDFAQSALSRASFADLSRRSALSSHDGAVVSASSTVGVISAFNFPRRRSGLNSSALAASRMQAMQPYAGNPELTPATATTRIAENLPR